MKNIKNIIVMTTIVISIVLLQLLVYFLLLIFFFFFLIYLSSYTGRRLCVESACVFDCSLCIVVEVSTFL